MKSVTLNLSEAEALAISRALASEIGGLRARLAWEKMLGDAEEALRSDCALRLLTPPAVKLRRCLEAMRGRRR